MDTQNTPVHVKLWHREFWMLAVANLLLMMSVYMLIPTLPPHLFREGLSATEVGSVMGVYGIGLFLLGGFCSYWVQRYRRHHVCQYAIVGVVVSVALLYYLAHTNVHLGCWPYLLARLLQGACLGLAQMTLSSTLVIDTCESFLRTEANHSAAWFARFALSLGPMVALVGFFCFGFSAVLALSMGFSICAVALIGMVRFPFKAPEEHLVHFSLDRFFLPQGFTLFLNLVLISTVVGLLLSLPHAELFYGMMMVGFLVALLAEKFAFADADLKSEVVTGIIMLAAAVLILFTRHRVAVCFVAPAMIGFGVGIIGSRFLLFFIKLAKHCQRGTSQSAFFLAQELGISIGLFLGIGFLGNHSVTPQLRGFLPVVHVAHENILLLSLVLLALSMVVYNFWVHPWYMKHRNR